MQFDQDAIGGFFELELRKQGSLFHDNCIALNTGRNSFEYLLTSLNITEIYIPYFSCDVLLEPIQKHGILYSYYHIDENFNPILRDLSEDKTILYIDYFGLCSANITMLKQKFRNLILDYSQSFFTKSDNINPSFYSPRKFFGLPDGGFATFIPGGSERDFVTDSSINRCNHLLMRAEGDVEAGYSFYTRNEASLSNQEIKLMSPLTKALLRNVDFESAKEQRKRNFQTLHSFLKDSNQLSNFLDSAKYDAPLIYPYFCSAGKTVREKLIKNKIYTPQYWTSVLSIVNKEDWEYQLTENLVCLPIDQRLSFHDLDRIISFFKK